MEPYSDKSDEVLKPDKVLKPDEVLNPFETFAEIGKMIINAVNELGMAFTAFGATLRTALGPFNHLVAEIDLNNAILFFSYSEDYAVEIMGITRVDIRTINFKEVRLWNHRKVPIDLMTVADYGRARVRSRRL